LLVPAALADAQHGGLLADALSGEDLRPGSVGTTTVAVPGVGPVQCAYSVERLDERSGLGSTGPPRDEHGRPLEMLYGVACATAGELQLDRRDLDVARSAALATYARLLTDERAFVPEESRPFALRSTVVSQRVPHPALSGAQPVVAAAGMRPPLAPAPRQAGSATRRRTWILPALVGSLVVLVGAVTWKVFLGPSPDVLTSVTVTASGYQAPACGSTVALAVSAMVTASADVNVGYRWQDASTGWRTARRKVHIGAAGSTTLSATVPIRVRPGRTAHGTVALVIETPTTRRATAPYAVRCTSGG
jgi:hypothetical protein